MEVRNLLRFEKSPYLLQHADNPVGWHPWGEEAFGRAREENKPIFLSIGYSTCHWCHVMEHESFEDTEVARLMNDAFVSIKVDREERPDIDSVYMAICQMMTGSGGWPLNIILTPDKKPFYAATYIPKEGRFQHTGMLELIPLIKEVWEKRHEEVLRSAEQITSALQQASGDSQGTGLDESTLTIAYEQLSQRFDEQYGGFGTAPKFPTPHNLLFLLRYWRRSRNKKALDMAEKTLYSMRNGGIYDHVGFGFHRYSTDREWLVPHFEKMLYDQAMLAIAYTEAYQATGKDEYKKTATEIFSYILRDMTSPSGGFYSAEDADSEGEEGRFYVWTGDEVRQLVGEKEAEIIIRAFNIENDGNFREQAAGEKSGKNILHLKKSLSEIASDLKIPEKDLRTKLDEATRKLFTSRERRIRPHKDDKILTDWNGLMIAALAKGAQAFDEPKYAEAAIQALNFILNNMRRPDGRLLHRYRDGQSLIPAYLDDYAFLTWGILELYEATFDPSYIKTALTLNQDLLSHFWDESRGGFYFTSDDSEELFTRPKEIYDGATPSGNSVAILNMLRLGRIIADSTLEERAAKIGSAFSRNIRQMPSAYTQFLVGLDFALGPSHEVVIAGGSGKQDTRAMLNALRREFLPNKILLFRPTEVEAPDISRLAPFTKDMSAIDGKATAYVCTNYSCKAPTTEIKKILELLNTRAK
ncbi:MAG: thioredoxin domain-containing protein, partial [Nitrospirota bacterium]